MIKYLLAGAALFAAIAPAEAKCSTAALDGEWIYFTEGMFSMSAYPVTIKGGKFFLEGMGYDVKVVLSSSCRGKVEMSQNGGPVYYGRAATERISKVSTLKPNLLDVNFMYNTTSGSGVRLFRKK